jgi:hypothetical protein
MLVILPYQGHGFGYRYLHGMIGSFILLAIYGWMERAAVHRALRSLIVRVTVGGFLILLPIQAWMAHGLYVPYAHASQAIDRTASDYAIVSEEDTHFAHDLVLNRPDLSNRPIRLIAENMNADLINQLCRSRPSVVVVRDHALAKVTTIFGEPSSNRAPKRNEALPATLRDAGCQVSVPK